MAVFRTGCFVLKNLTPVLSSPGFLFPSTVNVQVRNAARKGYREKKTRQRLAEKRKKAEGAAKNQQQMKIRSKYPSVRKTVNLNKPEPPNDDVFIIQNFNFKKYTLEEAVEFHKEYHHPTVFNNPNAAISVRFEIDMTGKKETQVLKPFSGIAPIHHPFVIKQPKEVIVFCHPSDVQMCLDCGASAAGGADLIKKVQEGIILPTTYNHVIAHTNILPDLVPIRGLLKDKLPRQRKGDLTDDLKSAIAKFLHGIEYTCYKLECDHNFGVISCDIGKVSMPTEHIVDNFKSLAEKILSHRPNETREFITWVWCFSPPSDEQFSLDLSKCLPTVKVKSDGEGKKAKTKVVEEKRKDEGEEEEEEEEEKGIEIEKKA